MAKGSNQKLKILYILQILKENTDEEHPISTPDIIERLSGDGISAERKSIYDDMEKLIDYGYDIIQVHSRKGGGYYLASREFELPELKLLVDAVQSSRFITQKKSRELIKKLEHMTSKYEARLLRRQVYVAERIKTENESIYYSVDAIHKAIFENVQISFTYLEWTADKQLKPRKEKRYQVSPWALLWQDENYYLAGYDANAAVMKHYRVDKMGDVQLELLPRLGMELFEKVDLAQYSNKTFGMFGGNQETVTLEFSERLIGVVVDRFGKEVDIRRRGENIYQVRTSVVVSGQFFGWLAGIGKEIVVRSPEVTKDQYRVWLEDIIKKL